jgi:biopolymer transport protein ExbD
MAIYVPGKRNRNNKLGSTKRSVVAVLSLTAMVDLFTVLVVFLLQNYATTGEVIDIPEGVVLPAAQEVKDLKPANVVIVTDTDVRLNGDTVVDLKVVKAQEDWMIEPLKQKLMQAIEKGQKEKAALGSQLVDAVQRIRSGDEKPEEEIDQFRKVTLQADREMDFLTLKKVMFTITEAGAIEINFAVIKTPKDTTVAN